MIDTYPDLFSKLLHQHGEALVPTSFSPGIIFLFRINSDQNEFNFRFLIGVVQMAHIFHVLGDVRV